ncbi:MAG TPA: hypothetical protein VKR83_13675 [Ktedonobacteraceae bacterium]|nr:hypothetical protein [Ktedonobacteraceae bacterium]
MEILIILMLLIAFSLAALRWGYNSTEPIDSPEWKKRVAPPFVGKADRGAEQY